MTAPSGPPSRPEISPAIRAMLRSARDMLRHEHSLLGSLGIEAVEVAAGRTIFALDLPEKFSDGAGAIHGGFLTIVLDSLFGLTVFTALAEFKPIATINLRTDYLGAARVGERILCESVCEAVAGEVAYVTGRILRMQDKAVIATGAGAFMVGTRGPKQESRL